MDLLKDRVNYAHQTEILGTAHAVKYAVEYIKETGVTIILPGDTPLVDKGIIDGMLEKHYKENNALTIGTLVLDDPYSFGRIIRDSNQNIVKIVEEGQATPEEKLVKEINTCMFVVNNDLLLQHLPRIDNNNDKKEYYITDIVKLIAADNHKVGTFTIEEQYKMAGINDLYQLSKVEKAFRKAINKEHMLNGVNIINPETVTIGPDVKIEAGVTIYPGTCLWGNTTIGKLSSIGPNTELTDVIVEENSKVMHSYLSDTTVKSNSNVGPFAYTRDGVVIGENTKVGAFVEVKNSTIGNNTFASHLAYIGDSEVGNNVNFGCGCITANFDGVNKYKTVIKDNSFIGCNSNLIAPITVGENSFIAAGTTVTEDVDNKSFVIGRSKMVQKENKK
jgi:bifunctional UDP-N-acetylglucosamine pyrophosphorylase/glucosamine-1-phosphate N-acetyltransferase